MIARSNAGERVLAVPRRILLERGFIRTGFNPGGLEEALAIVREHGEFVPRPEAERDPSWKQIIPYAVVHHRRRIFLMQRSRRGGEPRLYNRFSIGVGGHINPGPSDPVSRVEDGLRRELEEELCWPAAYAVHPLGMLNDDSEPVGEVHFGLVYRVEAPSARVAVRETELLSGGFAGLDEIHRRLPEMETWSQRVARALLERPDLLGGGSPPGSVPDPASPAEGSRSR
jgi:predicted NUDIX family phosphoesterase